MRRNSMSGTAVPGTAVPRSLARGEEIFNHRPLLIADVSGLNDDLGVAAIPGTCTTCHDTPQASGPTFPGRWAGSTPRACRSTPCGT
jgi:hypothetical protein